MSDTPQRLTRSRSSQPVPKETTATGTAPGPPIPSRDTSAKFSGPGRSNPYGADLVILFSIAVSRDRALDQAQIRQEYEALLRTLEGEGGLRVATKPGKKTKGKEQILVFVGAEDEKVQELVEREVLLDRAHHLPPHPRPARASPADRLRLLYALLTSPPLQHGLGITPGTGKWTRVQSIMALHDEEADHAWVQKWSLGGDWRVGLFKGLSEKEGEGLGEHQPPPVHLYFAFLSTYTLSLVPLAAVSIVFWLYTQPESYPALYAILLSLYSTVFVAHWRIRERKLAVQWGTSGCESVAVSRLRPEYVHNLGLDNQDADVRGGGAVEAIRAGNDLQRDVKVAVSIPIIAVSGVLLGCVLSGIFLLEAFVTKAYEGFGKEIVPLIPTALFSLVVPQVIGLYNKIAKSLVTWEDHPTPVGAEKSLTGKTFAMNGIVAYLGLFLSAYVYVPFGPFIMANVQRRLSAYEKGSDKIKIAASAEKAGLGPKQSAHMQASIKAGRLKGQLFAYTVTNQVVNLFLELGLPYVLRFVNDWRAGKVTVKEAFEKRGQYETEEGDEEQRFLAKVRREAELPDYSLFTDYAEMVTQFGYVVIWSAVWPLAPLFALINNYLELRADALKICKHVRRPVGDRVETIGAWLHTLGLIAWIGAVTNATLIYLFQPTTMQSIRSSDDSVSGMFVTGSRHLFDMHAKYSQSPQLATILPLLVPLVAIALVASHGYIVLRYVVEGIMERVFWRGSAEEMQIHHMRAQTDKTVAQQLVKLDKRTYKTESTGFWNGGEEGAREIGRVAKSD